MFIPIFIALLTALISPNHQNANCGQGTVQVNSTNETGGGGSTGGNTGQNPPPKDDDKSE